MQTTEIVKAYISILPVVEENVLKTLKRRQMEHKNSSKGDDGKSSNLIERKDLEALFSKLLSNFETQMQQVFNKLSIKVEKKLEEDCVKFATSFVERHRAKLDA